MGKPRNGVWEENKAESEISKRDFYPDDGDSWE
jgi:hypothetical protein